MSSSGRTYLAPDISSGRSSYLVPMMMSGDPVVWGALGPAASPPTLSSAPGGAPASAVGYSPYYPLAVAPSEQVAQFGAIGAGAGSGPGGGSTSGSGSSPARKGATVDDRSLVACERESLLTRTDIALSLGFTAVTGIVLCVQKPDYIMRSIPGNPDTGEPPRRVVDSAKLGTILMAVAGGILGIDIVYRLLS
jgi:hypothetical protein